MTVDCGAQLTGMFMSVFTVMNMYDVITGKTFYLMIGKFSVSTVIALHGCRLKSVFPNLFLSHGRYIFPYKGKPHGTQPNKYLTKCEFMQVNIIIF